MTASSTVALRSRFSGKRNASYGGSNRSRGGLGRRSCRGHRGRAPPAALSRRRLQGQGALPERRPAGEGQPRPDGRGADRQGRDDRPHAQWRGRGHDEAQRGLRPAAPRHAGDDPPGFAVRRRQPLHRPPHGAPERREDPGRRRDRAGLDDHGRRPRPALQHVRPRDAQGTPGRDHRVRGADRGEGQGVQRGHRLPEPVARRVQPSVPRAQPRHPAARALHRLLLPARHGHRRPS